MQRRVLAVRTEMVVLRKWGTELVCLGLGRRVLRGECYQVALLSMVSMYMECQRFLPAFYQWMAVHGGDVNQDHGLEVFERKWVIEELVIYCQVITHRILEYLASSRDESRRFYNRHKFNCCRIPKCITRPCQLFQPFEPPFPIYETLSGAFRPPMNTVRWESQALHDHQPMCGHIRSFRLSRATFLRRQEHFFAALGFPPAHRLAPCVQHNREFRFGLKRR